MIKIHYEVSSVYYSIQEVPLHKISRENVRVLSKIREKRESFVPRNFCCLRYTVNFFLIPTLLKWWIEIIHSWQTHASMHLGFVAQYEHESRIITLQFMCLLIPYAMHMITLYVQPISARNSSWPFQHLANKNPFWLAKFTIHF